MTAIRLTRAEFRALFRHKPSKGYMVRRKRKRAKDADRLMQDARWRAAVKARAGLRCEYCGKFNKGLQAHHIFTRSNKAVRWYVPNGVALCAGHHLFWAHKKPHEFRDWITAKRGAGWWRDLQDKANTRHCRYTGADTAADTKKEE